MLLRWEVLYLQNDSSANTSSRRECSGEVARDLCKSKKSHCKPGNKGYTCQCNDGYHGNPYDCRRMQRYICPIHSISYVLPLRTCIQGEQFFYTALLISGSRSSVIITSTRYQSLLLIYSYVSNVFFESYQSLLVLVKIKGTTYACTTLLRYI